MIHSGVSNGDVRDSNSKKSQKKKKKKGPGSSFRQYHGDRETV